MLADEGVLLFVKLDHGQLPPFGSELVLFLGERLFLDEEGRASLVPFFLGDDARECGHGFLLVSLRIGGRGVFEVLGDGTAWDGSHRIDRDRKISKYAARVKNAASLIDLMF